MAYGGSGRTTKDGGHKTATVVGSSEAQVYTKAPVRLKFRGRLLPPSSGFTVYSRDGGSKFL